MAMTIHVDIVSAEGAIHSGLATMVYAPAEMGEVGIAPRHTALITRLKPGDVRVQSEGGEIEHFYVSGGMLEVQPHLVTVQRTPHRAPAHLLAESRPLVLRAQQSHRHRLLPR